MSPAVTATPRGLVNPIHRGQRSMSGQQLNTNSVKSVSDSSKQGKNRSASGSKSNRRKTKKRKKTVEFVAIPKQDLIWAKEQKPSVMKFWMECWECDPYGSRWMTLNHSLSRSAFTKAKKILSDRGLFIFKPDHSIKDGRETVSWLVQNLHGSRRKNFGIKFADSDKADCDSDKADCDLNQAIDASPEASISSKMYTESQSQPPSITPHQRLTNSSKEISEALGVDGKASESDRDLALGGQVTSASLQEEKVKAEDTNLGDVQSDLVTKSDQNSNQKAGSAGEEAPPALNKKSTLNKESTKEMLNQPYLENRFSEESIVRSVAQNLAIEEEQKSETYQTSFKDAIARIKAKLQEQSSKQKLRHLDSTLFKQ